MDRRNYQYKLSRSILRKRIRRIFRLKHDTLDLEHLLSFSIILVVLFKCLAFIGVFFPCPDDMSFASYSFFNHGILNAAVKQAESQGRFYQIIFVFLSQVPYLFNSLAVLWIIRMLLTGFFVVSLYYLLIKMTQNRTASKLITLLFVSTYYFGGWYNSISTEPFWFGFADSFAFLGFGLLFSVNLSSGSKKTFKLSSGLILVMFASLSYEIMMVLPALYLYLLWKRMKKDEVQTEFRSNYIRLRKLTISAFIYYVLYALLYIFFSMKYRSDYSGTQLSIAPLKEIFFTNLKMSVAGFRAFKSVSRLSLDDWLHYWYLAVIAIFVASSVMAVMRSKLCVERIRSDISLIVICCLFAMYFNVGYALTERYRVRSRIDAMYLEASLSCIFFILAFYLLFSKLLSKRKVFVNVLVSSTLSIILFFGTAVNFMVLYKEEVPLRASSWTWDIAKYLCKNQANWMRHSPDIIVSPGLFNLTPRVDPNYWSYFFSKCTKRTITVSDSPLNSTNMMYLYIFSNHRKTLIFIDEQPGGYLYKNDFFVGGIGATVSNDHKTFVFTSASRLLFEKSVYNLS